MVVCFRWLQPRGLFVLREPDLTDKTGIFTGGCASRKGRNVQREEGSRRDKSRSLVARVAILREIEVLKPTDNTIERVVAKY